MHIGQFLTSVKHKSISLNNKIPFPTTEHHKQTDCQTKGKKISRIYIIKLSKSFRRRLTEKRAAYDTNYPPKKKGNFLIAEIKKVDLFFKYDIHLSTLI